MSSVNVWDSLEFEIEKTMRFIQYANCSVPQDLKSRMTSFEQDSYMMECLQDIDSMELLRFVFKFQPLLRTFYF